MDKSQEKKNLKRPQQEDDSYELVGYDDGDEQIQDDGQQSSEHSSIDLQEYLKNRDNIPSQPSDAQDKEEEDQDENDQDDNEDEDEQQQEKPKGTKKQKLEDKKKQKEASNKNNNEQDQEDDE